MYLFFSANSYRWANSKSEQVREKQYLGYPIMNDAGTCWDESEDVPGDNSETSWAQPV